MKMAFPFRTTSVLLLLALLSGCAASNFGDPTRPEIRKQHHKDQQQDLRSRFGNY